MATDYLTAVELARQFRLTVETVRQLARDGRIPCIRLGPKIIRFDPQAVAQTLATQAEGQVGHE